MAKSPKMTMAEVKAECAKRGWKILSNRREYKEGGIDVRHLSFEIPFPSDDVKTKKGERSAERTIAVALSIQRNGWCGGEWVNEEGGDITTMVGDAYIEVLL